MEEKTEKAAKNAEQAKPAGTDKEQRMQFLELQQELEKVENELDRYEDNLEMQYAAGELSRDEYKIRDMALEQLENRLDHADDQLELNFGIDD